MLDIWSCNPADIEPWTDEDKARLQAVLANVFGWEAQLKEPKESIIDNNPAIIQTCARS